MKTVHSILLTSLLALFLTSCTKESFDEKIVGKWQRKELYRSSNNGSDFQWTAVPDPDYTDIEFSENGRFSRFLISGRCGTSCSGTYLIINNDQIQINSHCYDDPTILAVNLSKKELTIIYHFPDGQVKEKFVRL